MTNSEIVDIYLKNGLIDRCVECQWAKKKNGRQNKEDFYQDLILILLEYDNKKMNNAHKNKHMNALISKIIVNNIFSKNSPYYKTYEKFENKSETIDKVLEEENEDEDRIH